MTAWSKTDIPDQTGRIAVVTGATSGIGLEAARALAAAGAELVLAVRDTQRGEALATDLTRAFPHAKRVVHRLDVANLASVRDFAAWAVAMLPRIDILLNNAGLGLQDVRAETVDGFERQFGTNHLGHFALTGQLIPVLLRAPAPRVVTIASIAHRRGAIDFDDLQGAKFYSGRKAYGQSKLANLMFALELDRRARLSNSHLASLAAHPGLSVTGFIAATGMPGYKVKIGLLGSRLIGQDAEHGARPGLYAATMPDAQSGQYWGPDGFMEIRGNPALAKLAPQARDQAVWSRLWAESERLTGVFYPPLAG